jgi:hypothetical protein
MVAVLAECRFTMSHGLVSMLLKHEESRMNEKVAFIIGGNLGLGKGRWFE